MPHQELIDFMARADYEELASWVHDEVSWIGVAQTGMFGDPGCIRARVTSRTGPLDAMLMAIARHRAMEGGNG
jgi:hypothetical protein